MEKTYMKVSQQEKMLREKYDELSTEWKELVSKAKNDKEYENTRPKFDKMLSAHTEWQEYLFKNALILLLHRRDG